MIAETRFTVEDFRKRIQVMTDEKLVQTGKAARYMAAPRNSADKRTVRPVDVTQLRLCREEWMRRHPKLSTPPK
jgi:ABC-type proline/glycine betaine transport system ATPase subunit